MNELIDLIKTISIDYNTDIPIELVLELDRLRKEINHLDKPSFINTNGKPVNNHWEEFKFTGLNNVDYITSEFYLDE